MNLQNEILYALKQQNIVVVDNEEDRRREGCGLVAPILKDFCAENLKIKNPEIAVFNVKNEEDIKLFGEKVSECFEKYHKNEGLLFPDTFPDYIAALNYYKIFPVMHNFDSAEFWNDKTREIYGYILPNKSPFFPKAILTVSQKRWKKRNDYNEKISCCWRVLGYNESESKWELGI